MIDARTLGPVTGLVYLAIIALWAMFLIPWLGRHRDDQNGRRSADRFHKAMDTLAREGSTPAEDGYDGVEDGGHGVDEDDASRFAPAALPPLGQAWTVVLAAMSRPGARRGRSAASRRRRVLGVLTVGLLATVAGVLAGVLPGASPAVFGALIALYLIVLVGQSVRARRASAADSRHAQTDRFRQAANRAQEQARDLLVDRSNQDAGSERRWDAVEATLPTYVSKPRASKVPRVVDLTSPGREWTGEAMVQRAQAEQRKARTVAQAQFDREMAAIGPDPIAEVAELANLAEVPIEKRQTYRRAANG